MSLSSMVSQPSSPSYGIHLSGVGDAKIQHSKPFCSTIQSLSTRWRLHNLPEIYSCHKLCTLGIQTSGGRLKGLQSFKAQSGWQEERRCNIFSNGKLLQSRPPGFIQCTASQLSYPINATDFSEANVDYEKVGVLLLNLGGPDTLHDVQPFLYNLFADPDIIRLPRLFRFLQQPLAKFISVTRAPKAKEGYKAIGGGSPLRKITNEQADALKEALKSKKLPVNLYVGMRYWHPFTEEAIEQIKRDRVTKLVVLPLYPHFSISTTGSSISVLQSIFRKDEYFLKLPYSIIQSWYQREGYIKTMADLTEKELSKFANSKEVVIFFSAHGVPCAYVEKYSDPYKSQMEESVDLIIKELKCRGVDNEHILAYQSRVGPVEWLKPYTDETITQLGQKGVKNLLVVPISFVSEHIETLEEIDQEYRHLALSSGIENWGRVPTLGCQPAFIKDLADAVVEALPFVKSMLSSEHSPQQADTNKRSLITEIIR